MKTSNYCAWCGKQLTEPSDKCPNCNKALPPKDRLFLNFLIDHTKDKIKGDIEDSVYETVKNYLLSHLYGVIVGLTVIVVAAAAIFFGSASPYSHISQVDSIDEVRPAEDYSTALSAQDKAEIKTCLENYVSALDDARFMAGNDTYLYLISDDLYFSLQNPAEDYLYYNFYNDEANFPYIRIEDDPTNTVTLKEDTFTSKVESAAGLELEELGYQVAAVEITHSLYAAAVDSANPVGSADYTVTLAKENGQWLIVEILEA